MIKLKEWLKRDIFLAMVFLLLIGHVSYFCYRPIRIKEYRSKIIKRHEERVSVINEAIKKAIELQGGTVVIGNGISQQDQAKMDEIRWKEQLVLENKKFDEDIGSVEFNFASGEFVAWVGVYVALLGLHFHKPTRQSE